MIVFKTTEQQTAPGQLCQLPVGVRFSRPWLLILLFIVTAGCWRNHAKSTEATNGLTLDAAIRIALDDNPRLRASGARVQGAAARAYQAKLWSNPELELSAEDWPVSGGNGFTDSKRTVGLSQTLPFPGKKKLDRQIGASGMRVAEQELNQQRLEVVREVKTAFFQVIAIQGSVEVARELVTVAESSANAASKRVTAGAAADQEQLRAEILLEETRTDLAAFERELADARQTLATVMGRPDLAQVAISGALVDRANPDLLRSSPEWLTNYPALKSALASRDNAELELRRARLEPYPDVRAGVSGGVLGETGQSIIQLGFSLPLPIIDWGKGKRGQAEANLRVAEADLATLEQRLLREWRVASQRLRTAAEQVASYRERILPKAQQAWRLVQIGFEQGKFGFIDLLDTQRTSAEARLAFQRKLLELNVAQTELETLLIQLPVEATSVRKDEMRSKQ